MNVAEEVEAAAKASDDIAADIERLANAAEQLLGGRLTRRALVVLLRDDTGLPMTSIASVLNALPNLRIFLKGKK